MSDSDFLTLIQTSSKFKQRSHDTHHIIHLPELNTRLNHHLDLPNTPEPAPDDDPFIPRANMTNKEKIQIVFLGNSMLERFKTTGAATKLGQLAREGAAWNAGCEGDKNENVLYRLHQGLYQHLKTAQEEGRCNIKLVILASGTNNLHVKRGLHAADVESYRLLVQSCLRIAPSCTVLACDMFYRNDVPGGLVDAGNMMLKSVAEVSDWAEKVKWIEWRKTLGKEMLDDHVHLNEAGNAVWSEALWKVIAELGLGPVEEK